MKYVFAIAIALLLPTLAQAQLADGSLKCDINGSAQMDVKITATEVILLTGTYAFSSAWQPLDPGSSDFIGSFKAERFPHSIILAIDSQSDQSRLVGTVVINEKGGNFTLTSTVSMVDKINEDADVNTWVWKCVP